jgi:hypothetical protein
MFNSQECAYSDQSFSIFGGATDKLIGLKFTKKKEKEAIYGDGNQPGGIGDGNISYEGSIKVLKGQIDAWNAAAKAAGYADILDIPAPATNGTVMYKAAYNRPLAGWNLIGIAFTEMPYGWEQGAKKMEVELPIMFLGLTPIV